MFYFNYGITPMMPFAGFGFQSGFGFRPNFYTGQPNFGLWNMNPYNLLGNFGGTYQFSTYPSEYTLQDVMACKNAANPFYYSNYFLNTFMSMMSPYAGMQQSQLVGQAAELGAAMGTETGLTIGINSTASSIASVKHKIEQSLKKDDLTDEQKAELEEAKQQVEDLEKRLEELVEDKNARNKAVKDLQAELRDISSDNTAISKNVDKILAGEETEETEQTEETEDPENPNGPKETGDPEDPNGPKETEDPEDPEDPNGTKETEDPEKTKASRVAVGKIKDIAAVDKNSLGEDIIGAGIDDPNIAEIGNKLHQMIDGLIDGSTNSEIKEYIENNINKDNVVEVMLYWNKNFAAAYSDADPNGMTETIFDEFFAKGKNAVKPFVTALQERLKEYEGVDPSKYSEASAQLSIAQKEVDSWYCYEDKTAKAINKAHRAIVELMVKQGEQKK